MRDLVWRLRRSLGRGKSDTPYVVVAAEYRGDRRVFLRFEDDSEGEIDLGPLLKYQGVFAPLADDEEFARVRIEPDDITISWPCGADLAPEPLYEYVTGIELEPGRRTPEEQERFRLATSLVRDRKVGSGSRTS